MMYDNIGRTCELCFENGERYLLELTGIMQEYNPLEISSIRLDGNLLRKTVPFKPLASSMKYKKVVYNDPATIVLWEDGTKTVVKCDPKDDYDPVKGLALCFMKKALGNTSRALNDVLHKDEPNAAI